MSVLEDRLVRDSEAEAIELVEVEVKGIAIIKKKRMKSILKVNQNLPYCEQNFYDYMRKVVRPLQQHNADQWLGCKGAHGYEKRMPLQNNVPNSKNELASYQRAVNASDLQAKAATFNYNELEKIEPHGPKKTMTDFEAELLNQFFKPPQPPKPPEDGAPQAAQSQDKIANQQQFNAMDSNEQLAQVKLGVKSEVYKKYLELHPLAKYNAAIAQPTFKELWGLCDKDLQIGVQYIKNPEAIEKRFRGGMLAEDPADKEKRDINKDILQQMDENKIDVGPYVSEHDDGEDYHEQLAEVASDDELESDRNEILDDHLELENLQKELNKYEPIALAKEHEYELAFESGNKALIGRLDRELTDLYQIVDKARDRFEEVHRKIVADQIRKSQDDQAFLRDQIDSLMLDPSDLYLILDKNEQQEVNDAMDRLDALKLENPSSSEIPVLEKFVNSFSKAMEKVGTLFNQQQEETVREGGDPLQIRDFFRNTSIYDVDQEMKSEYVNGLLQFKRKKQAEFQELDDLLGDLIDTGSEEALEYFADQRYKLIRETQWASKKLNQLMKNEEEYKYENESELPNVSDSGQQMETDSGQNSSDSGQTGTAEPMESDQQEDHTFMQDEDESEEPEEKDQVDQLQSAVPTTTVPTTTVPTTTVPTTTIAATPATGNQVQPTLTPITPEMLAGAKTTFNPTTSMLPATSSLPSTLTPATTPVLPSTPTVPTTISSTNTPSTPVTVLKKQFPPATVIKQMTDLENAADPSQVDQIRYLLNKYDWSRFPNLDKYSQQTNISTTPSTPDYSNTSTSIQASKLKLSPVTETPNVPITQIGTPVKQPQQLEKDEFATPIGSKNLGSRPSFSPSQTEDQTSTAALPAISEENPMDQIDTSETQTSAQKKSRSTPKTLQLSELSEDQQTQLYQLIAGKKGGSSKGTNALINKTFKITNGAQLKAQLYQRARERLEKDPEDKTEQAVANAEKEGTGLQGSGSSLSPNYIPLGSVFLDLKQLEKGMLRAVTKSGILSKKIPRQKISYPLQQALQELVHSGHAKPDGLSERDHALFSRVCHASGAAKGLGMKERFLDSDTKRAKDRYELLAGMMSEGNDSPAVRKELKTLSHHLHGEGLVSKAHFMKIQKL